MKNLIITPREKDFSSWYLNVISAADLAEHAESVKGCMIIKPYGYLLWEKMTAIIDGMFKEMGIENAYFPLFIPMSFLTREKEHIEGFSPELAVVTHGGGEKLEEPLVVRPTSETIIYDAFSRWIQSYRDLPMVINQWANVVRWEKRPRLFLRTTEFLWQEGHTAHRTSEEAEAYALMILNKVYKIFAEEWLAMPVLTGRKSEKEKFAGAKNTYCIEALAQDGKSIQAGTSHDLSDHFAKPFNITYADENQGRKSVFQTSWGVSTRLIGALIMMHSDDSGLVLPPKMAPIQAVITTVGVSNEAVSQAVKDLAQKLKAMGVRVRVDDRDLRLGEKCYEWEKKGVPVRIEIGQRDLDNGVCVMARRDTKVKETCTLEKVADRLAELLQQIQIDLFTRAQERIKNSNKVVDDWADFVAAVEQGGYIYAHWCENSDCEAKIKEKTKATTRCFPFTGEKESGEHKCIHCGKPSASNKRWIFAKAY